MYSKNKNPFLMQSAMKNRVQWSLPSNDSSVKKVNGLISDNLRQNKYANRNNCIYYSSLHILPFHLHIRYYRTSVLRFGDLWIYEVGQEFQIPNSRRTIKTSIRIPIFLSLLVCRIRRRQALDSAL